MQLTHQQHKVDYLVQDGGPQYVPEQELERFLGRPAEVLAVNRYLFKVIVT